MPRADTEHLVTAIEKCEQLASGKWWRRLWHHPYRFVKAIGSRSFLKLFFNQGINTTAVTFFGAAMQVRLPAGTDIYLTGAKSHPSEIRLAKWMLHNIEPGWTVLDVGAHFGYYTLLLHKLTGSSGKVISFEPSPLAYSMLEININQAAGTIVSVNLGVTGTTGRQLLATRGVLASESNSFYDLAGATTILATTTTLDDWLALHKIVPRFMKADVEGGEWEMVKGAMNTLFLYQPIIAMEIRTIHFEACYYPAIEWLKANGYRLYSLAVDGGLMHCADAWSYLQSSNTQSDNFLFIPKKRRDN